MTNEIHDELLNPGCPQCARKHLESALAYLIGEGAPRNSPAIRIHDLDKDPASLLARALINFDEYIVGYDSHIRLVRGFLEQFEMACVLQGDREMAQWARRLRCALSEPGGTPMTTEVYDVLHARPFVAPIVFAWAHVKEAIRELPDLRCLAEHLTCDLVLDMIMDVEVTYFQPVTGVPPKAPAINHNITPKGDDHGYESKKVCALR